MADKMAIKSSFKKIEGVDGTSQDHTVSSGGSIEFVGNSVIIRE